MTEANSQTLKWLVEKHARTYSKIYGVPEGEAIKLFSEMQTVPEVNVPKASSAMTTEQKKARLEELRKKHKGN